MPAIVAESDLGCFSELLKNESANLWIQSLAEDMKTIKMLDDKKLNFTSAEIHRNRDFWNIESLQLKSEIQKANQGEGISDKNGHEDWPPLILEYKGHYEYGYTDIYTETYDSIRKLTNTYWHQNSPYNDYCPYISQQKIMHAPAGCVAIAAAQVLFFLNQRFGVPQMAPSKAYCNGTINDKNYDWAQTDYNSEIWYNMWLNPAYSAPLIADIGRRLPIKYDKKDSAGSISDIPKNVFEPYGISSTYEKYNVDKLKNSLLNGLPVILRADALDTESESGKTGHAFIADRYKRVRIRREIHYIWTWDPQPSTDPTIDQPLLWNRPDSIVVSYQSPEINMIGMNWGNGFDSNTNSEWFSLTGDWIKGSSGENYDINRAMVYINGINF